MKYQFHLIISDLYLNLADKLVAPSAGASVNVRVVPLRVNTVLPKIFVVFVNTLSTYKVIVSLFALRFVKVNVDVSPSPLNVSLVTFSKIIAKGLDVWLNHSLVLLHRLLDLSHLMFQTLT